MKNLKLIMIFCCILSLGITSCQNAPTQAAPIAEDDLKTLVAGTLTAVAFDIGQTQTLSVPPTETSTATITVPPPTAAPTETPTREVVTVTLSGNTNCRKGASTYFPIITTFSAGSVLEVLAINPAGDYFYVRAPDSETEGCWIWKEFTTVAGNVDSLLVYTPIPTPLPTSTSTPLPRVVYTVKFVGLTTCETGYAANFSINNTGNLTLQSIRIRNYLKGVTVPYVHESNSFTQWSAGEKYVEMADLTKGETMIVSTCDPGGFPTDPTGTEITAEIYICPQDGFKGACTTTEIVYTPH